MKYNIQYQHNKKKYHAIERISLLLDKDTFRELGSKIQGNNNIEYDAVITGHGTINGKDVFVFLQDFSLSGGTIGLYHGKKIANTIKMAISCKCPVIGIYDSGGARINEGINSLAGCGEIMKYNTWASGYIPQIAVVLGPCAGAAAYSPALNDFIFCVNSISNMYITGPSVVESVTGETCTAEELGGAQIHANVSGVAHVICNSEKECFKKVRRLIDYLPACCIDGSQKSFDKTINNFGKRDEIKSIIPANDKKSYNVKKIIDCCFDDNSFFEIHENFAISLVVGFAKLYGSLVGVIANQPLNSGGALDCNSSDKGARFVRFCDAFNIPIITFVDTPGYLPGMEQEHNGIIRHGAKLLYSYAEAVTAKVTVILRKAHGGAYIAMGSKHLNSDIVFALPNAEIAVMGAEGAVRILNKRELQNATLDDVDSLFLSKVTEYKENFLNAEVAARQGYVDEIIEIGEIRDRIGLSLQILKDKAVPVNISKRHGNIPL